MQRVMRGIGIALGSLLGLLVVVAAGLFVAGGTQFSQQFDVDPAPVAIPTDAEAVAQGQYIAETRGCQDCHGPDLSGGVLIDDPAFAVLPAPNLTAGQGGIAAGRTGEDWVRSIRHGVRPDGTGVIIMPSHEYYHFGDEDLGALIAYVQQLEPVDNVLPQRRIGPVGRVMAALGQFPPLPATMIAHDAPRVAMPEPGVTVEYGEYLARLCTGCHGPDFSGGVTPGSAPDSLPAANLTPAGNLANWTQEDFINTLRTGVTPEGRELDPSEMPWETIGRSTDNDLAAIWLYLQTLPPAE